MSLEVMYNDSQPLEERNAHVREQRLRTRSVEVTCLVRNVSQNLQIF